MNSSVYLFGRLTQGYTQYPNDHTQSIFQVFASKATAKTQIVIHRENNLMYYGYVRLMDINQSQYLGMCIVLNDLLIKDIAALFNLFQNTFTSIVTTGDILKLDENGNVISNVAQVNEQQYEMERILNLLQNSIIPLDKKSDKLPPVSYGISSSEVKKFTILDPIEEIIDAIHKYSYTVIYKNNGYETNTLKGYKDIIKRLKKENGELNEKLQNLSVDYNKILGEKKRSTLVSILCACIVLFLVIGYTVVLQKENLISEKENQITNQENKLENLTNQTNSLRQKIIDKDKSIIEKENVISDKYKQIERLNDSIYDKDNQISILKYIIDGQRATIHRLEFDLRSEKQKYDQLKKRQSATSSSMNTRRYVKVYVASPLLSEPNDGAKEICKVYNEVLILNKMNERYYHVKYGSVEGYLSKEWIRDK